MMEQQMKTIQLVGSRDKTDFVLYFAHVLSNLNKRVLVVDATKTALYRHSFTRLVNNQRVFDFQGIDILCDAPDWLAVEKQLAIADEAMMNYDVVLVDMDSKEMLMNDWPVFDERFYIGDYDRAHQLLDVELLHMLFAVTGTSELKRITFTSDYPMNESYFETLLDQDVLWKSMNYTVEPDEMAERIRLRMQHEQVIPYKQLSKQYKEALQQIVSELYGLHVKDVADAVRPSIFQAFKRTRKPALESSKA